MEILFIVLLKIKKDDCGSVPTKEFRFMMDLKSKITLLIMGYQIIPFIKLQKIQKEIFGLELRVVE